MVSTTCSKNKRWQKHTIPEAARRSCRQIISLFLRPCRTVVLKQGAAVGFRFLPSSQAGPCSKTTAVFNMHCIPLRGDPSLVFYSICEDVKHGSVKFSRSLKFPTWNLVQQSRNLHEPQDLYAQGTLMGAWSSRLQVKSEIIPKRESTAEQNTQTLNSH